MSEASRRDRLDQAARHATVLDDSAEVGARKYAEALVNVAATQGSVDGVLESLDEILEKVVRLHPELSSIFGSPTLAQSDRDRLLVRLFGQSVEPLVLNFLRLLNRSHRLDLLPAITRHAHESWDRRQGRKVVLVRSAVPLDESQQARLSSQLRALTASEPVLKLEVDPSLIGGLLVQVGDQVYDCSLRSQLERLRRQLVQEKLQEVRGQLAETAATA
jgi:F-type H+-transporting ATPase subunit delta